jgi:preprotein translocase subunit YajC
MTLTVIVLIVLAVVLIALLAFAMSRPAKLRPHRRRGGKPAARMRYRRRSE